MSNKTSFKLSALFILFLFLASCAPPRDEAGKSGDHSSGLGSIALSLQWPENTQPRSERVLFDAPAGVFRVRITIVGSSIPSPIINTYNATPGSPGSATINNVPVGTCIVFVDGLNATETTLLFSGWVSGVSVVADQPTTPSPVVMSPDDYPDNLPNATALAIGNYTSGTIDVYNDIDCFKFTALSGYDYVIAASGTSSGMDTEITLYNASGSQVGNNDDIVFAVDLDSQIILTNATAGLYYVEVTYSDYATQDVGDYDILVTETGSVVVNW